jgi:tetratricopeptide (TPR) repeat protein
MNDKNIREQLDGMKRPELNRLAKDLKVKKVRDFKKDELINHLIEHFPAEDMLKILNVPWWKRLLKQPNHIYGIITIIALICAFLFFYFSQKGDEKVHEGMKKVENTLQRYDPLKRDELLKEKEKKIEELKTALQDECRGDSKERKQALAELEKGNVDKVLPLLEKSIKTKSCNLAKDYYLKGNVHYSKNQPDYQQALRAYLEAARLEPGNAEYLNSIGLTYLELAKYNKAIEYFEKALALDTGVHGDEHWDVAVRLNNLGLAWLDLGNYQKAVEYSKKALTICEKMLGSQHPHTKAGKENLAYAVKKRSGKR